MKKILLLIIGVVITGLTVFAQPPTVTTTNVSYLGLDNATIVGSIDVIGGSPVTSFGFTWNTTGSPWAGVDPTIDLGPGSVGGFSANIGPLTPNTTYYVAAYATNLDGDNYGLDITFTTYASKIVLTVTAGNKTKIYGDANPPLTISYSGFVDGDDETVLDFLPTTSTLIDATSPVFNYLGGITVSGGSDDKYDYSYFDGDFNVDPRPLTITSGTVLKTYGDALSVELLSTNFTTDGNEASGETVTSVTLTPDAAGLLATTPAGDAYVVTPSNPAGAGTFDIANYDITYVDYNGTVDLRPLTITAGTVLKTYGDALSVELLSTNFTTDGNEASGETVMSVTLTPDAAGVSLTTAAGASYVVTPSNPAGAGTFDVANYDITYVDYNGTVDLRPLTITAGTVLKTYGDALSVELLSTNFTTDGNEASGETVMSVTLTPDAAGVSPTTAAGASYVVTPSNPAGAGTFDVANYDITYVDYNGTVDLRPLTITATGPTKTYGDALTAGPSATDFTTDGNEASGETVTSVTLTPDAAGIDASTPAGDPYVVTPSNPVGAGTFDVANYDITYTAYNGIVAKAMLTVTAHNKTKVYGEVNPALTYHHSGFVLGEDSTVIDTPVNITTTVTQNSGAGFYNDSITISGGIDNNYDFTYVPGDFDITKAWLTVTADNKTKIYGAANPTLTFTYSGWVLGVETIDVEPTISTGINVLSPVAVYVDTIKVVGGSDNNYQFIYDHGNFTIEKAPITATAENKTRIYGDPNPAFTIIYTGFVNDEDETVLDLPLPTASTVATITSNVGNYDINVTGGLDNNYYYVYVKGILSITKADLTVTAVDTFRYYGDPNPVFRIAYTGFKNNETATVLDTKPTATCAATLTSPAGTYDINVSGGLDNNYNYTPYVKGTLTIRKAPLYISTYNLSRLYGDPNPTFSMKYIGFKNLETTAVLDSVPKATTMATVLSPVGEYDIIVSGGYDNNYEFFFSPAKLFVNQRMITVTGNQFSREYGIANPTFTWTYTGFVNGDTEAVIDVKPSASTTATVTSPVGTYEIPIGGASDNNYFFYYVRGLLYINKATITVTANNLSKVYGADVPQLTMQYVGFRNGETAAVLDEMPVATTDATKTSSVGGYDIVVSGGSDTNYAINRVNGALNITKAALTVTADNKTKVYGEANPALTFVINGFVNGETASVLDVQPTVTSVATATSNAGNYDITVAGANDGDYSFTYVKGSLTISKAPLTVTAENKSKAYGEANPAFTVAYAGFVNGETAAVLDAAPTAATTATATSNAGTYDITVSGGSDNNYALTYAKGTLTVNKVALTVTADNQTRVYGAANPALTMKIAGFVGGETSSVIDVLPTVGTTATATSSVGTYDINATGGSDNNYTFTFVKGTLTITKATLTAKADNKTRVNGEANPALTITYSGFLNNETAAVLDVAPTASTTATQTSKTGTYDITVASGSDNNYTFTYEKGILTVTSSVGIDNIGVAEISLYPNPARNYVMVKSQQGIGENVNVYTITGSLVRKATLENKRLDVSMLRSGVYLLEVEGRLLKFVKE